ncbi:hypothetical protein EDC04DRAFT_251128 [Pisolithus marmoratus]|nr:hypothetical protein EDC04DRAFT_251128 [Pisolithus marmoratus]
MDSRSPTPNIQPPVRMPFSTGVGVLLQLNQVASVPSSRLHGQTSSENQERRLEDTIQLSRYQEVVKEASKYTVLPYLVPTPDAGSMAKEFIGLLQKKQVFLAELANTEAACEDYELALRRYLGDAAVERLMKAHFVIQEPQTVKGKYVTAVAGMDMRQFCQSRQPLVSSSLITSWIRSDTDCWFLNKAQVSP